MILFTEFGVGGADRGVFGGQAWSVCSWNHLPGLGRPSYLQDEADGALLALSQRHCTSGACCVLAGSPLGDSFDFRSLHAQPSVEDGRGASWSEARCRFDALTSRAFRRLAASRPPSTATKVPKPVVDRTAARLPLKKVAQYERQLARHHGEVRLEATEGRSLGREVEAVLAMRESLWRSQRRWTTLSRLERSAAHSRFLCAVAERLGETSMARVSKLTAGGRTIARDLYLGCADDSLLYLRAYDPEFARYSPGTVLLARSLERLFNSGAPSVDLGRGAEQYKFRFGARLDYVISAEWT